MMEQEVQTPSQDVTPQQPKSGKKKLIKIIVIVIILVGILVIIFASGVLRRETPREALIRDQIEDFKEFISQNPVPTLFGRITVIDEIGGVLIVNIPEIMTVPIAPDSQLYTREIIVAFDTEISERQYKSEFQFQDELRQFRDEVTETGVPIEPPGPFLFIKLEIEDLKVGDRIRIRAEGRSDIQNLLIINAAEIVRVQ